MPSYVEQALARFRHLIPKILQHQPHKHTLPTYGATIQYAKDNDATKLLSKEEKKYIQQILGSFLYYGQAVDSTMLTTLSSIASTQAEPTKETMENIKLFLNYVASHQDAILTYQASDMVLIVHSNTSYLSKPKARSSAGGHFFMSSDITNPHNNGAVLNIAQLIKAVMSLAAEAELGALYINAHEAVPMRQLLTEMGHIQPRTPIQTNNSTACGVVNSNLQPRQTKAMDMRFHWLRCREAQHQFRFHWAPGKSNLDDYWTKHHCAAHHIEKRPTILTPQSTVTALWASLHHNPVQLAAKAA
jgi:hypothetical protein